MIIDFTPLQDVTESWIMKSTVGGFRLETFVGQRFIIVVGKDPKDLIRRAVEQICKERSKSHGQTNSAHTG